MCQGLLLALVNRRTCMYISELTLLTQGPDIFSSIFLSHLKETITVSGCPSVPPRYMLQNTLSKSRVLISMDWGLISHSLG